MTSKMLPACSRAGRPQRNLHAGGAAFARCLFCHGVGRNVTLYGLLCMVLSQPCFMALGLAKSRTRRQGMNSSYAPSYQTAKARLGHVSPANVQQTRKRGIFSHSIRNPINVLWKRGTRIGAQPSATERRDDVGDLLDSRLVLLFLITNKETKSPCAPRTSAACRVCALGSDIHTPTHTHTPRELETCPWEVSLNVGE